MKLRYKNIDVNYTDSGTGSIVVLLHGFLENISMWKYLEPALSQKYRVVSIDLLGHGETGCLGYVHSMEDNAAMVHAVLSELKIKKAVFAGHSMGGYVALAFAELYPKMAAGIALVNSTALADSDERKANRDRAIKAVKENYTNFVRMSIANLFSEDNREKLASEIEEVKKEALKTPLQGVIASLEGMKIRKNREQLLHYAKYPILLTLGKKDTVLVYEENAAQIKGTKVRLVTFPDGHMSPIENREELENEVLSLLKSISL